MLSRSNDCMVDYLPVVPRYVLQQSAPSCTYWWQRPSIRRSSLPLDTGPLSSLSWTFESGCWCGRTGSSLRVSCLRVGRGSSQDQPWLACRLLHSWCSSDGTMRRQCSDRLKGQGPLPTLWRSFLVPQFWLEKYENVFG